MGVFGSISGKARSYYPSGPEIAPVAPNPNPSNFKFVETFEADGFLLVKINYPDCTTYEGNKVLLFKDVRLIDLVNQRHIDPHFLNDPNFVSPIARFVPTEAGWNIALTLISALQKY